MYVYVHGGTAPILSLSAYKERYTFIGKFGRFTKVQTTDQFPLRGRRVGQPHFS